MLEASPKWAQTIVGFPFQAQPFTRRFLAFFCFCFCYVEFGLGGLPQAKPLADINT